MTSASLSTLRELRLADMAAAYEALLAQPLDQQPDGHEIVARLVDAERQGRAHRRTQLNLRLSKLRYAATLQDIDCSPARNLTSNQLAVLTDPAWMGRGENVLITGATGCGKSYLACALGNHACALGGANPVLQHEPAMRTHRRGPGPASFGVGVPDVSLSSSGSIASPPQAAAKRKKPAC